MSLAIIPPCKNITDDAVCRRIIVMMLIMSSILVFTKQQKQGSKIKLKQIKGEVVQI